MRHLGVLSLPFVPPSIGYRTYRDNVNGTPFLRWFADWFSVTYPDIELAVLAWDDVALLPDKAPILKHLRVVTTSHATEVRAFADAALELEAPHAAFFGLGLWLAPDDLLTRLFEHHESLGNNYSPVFGLPRGCAPAVYETRLLVELAQQNPLTIPTHPGEVLNRMLSLAGITRQPPEVKVKARPFNAAAHYRLDPTELPNRIEFEGPRDMEIARQVVALRATASPTPDAALRLWKQISARMERERSAGSRPGVPWVQPVPPPTASSLTVRRTTENGALARILYVSNPSGFSGAEESLCQMIRHVDRSRFELFGLVALEGHFTAALSDLGVQVCCPNHEFATPTVENVEFVLKAVRDIRPDIVHLNAGPNLPAVFAAKLCDISLVIHLRISDVDDGLASQLRNAGRVIAVSQFAKRQALRWNVPAERIEVIYDEVDTDAFRPDLFNKRQAREKLSIPVSAKVALMIARFAPNKRHDVMLEAAALLKHSLPDFHLALNAVPDQLSGYREWVLDRIEQLKLSDCVKIVSFLPDIRELHAAADALVLCSEREPLGRCVVEAMAMQVPAVVTNSGGSHEIVGDGETGFVVKSNDPKAIADRLTELFQDEGLRTSLGRAARERAVRTLDARLSAQRIMGIYGMLLSTAKPEAEGLTAEHAEDAETAAETLRSPRSLR